MGQLVKYEAAGVEVVDEAVACTLAVVIGEVTYYLGCLLNTCSRNIYGTNGIDAVGHGVWTAAAMGGTRLAVALAGYPGGVGTVAIDPQRGYVWSTTSRTVYVRYLAHGPVYFSPLGGLRIANAPTSDPHVAGVAWSNGGVLTISAG